MSILFGLSCVFIIFSMIFCFIRLFIGPDLSDRVIAMDLLTNILIASVILFSLVVQETVYIDFIILVGLVMFLSISMYAYYLEKQ
ncbi:cation:proton antiporter [Legionella israelensis]|uniref:Cation:proton antiporter n=1 Tax=Legionella israelensis TaxID=454 RepID=A0A0W0WIH9_9GAMM|nr:monovalent cation/H+ antiporter complex subunit F [Legionella israelensis]KTD32130.1 Na(+)/H(+) antiporter subunit F1 [Legionella israelensis]QBR84872.1 cation:proton antiporter [Legionella israelensis]QBS10250.1 cation:proton antiporter [Legionella israelensis]SCY21158.1 multisubunit sodium/proton antiporter, MrpF subunit [Legionella israelensis DSM 19235]STX59844.1 Mrp complex subunit F1 [Legionella israelensis]